MRQQFFLVVQVGNCTVAIVIIMIKNIFDFLTLFMGPVIDNMINDCCIYQRTRFENMSLQKMMHR